MSRTIVIIGANLAGSTAAFTLRDEGFDGDIILIGDEPHAPYERPPLSKSYLKGDKSLDDIIGPSTHYKEKRIMTRFGIRAKQVHPDVKVVELDNGEQIAYDKVLIATGVRNRKLLVKGADLDGIYNLRDVSDADFIRKECVAGRKAVIVGMGFIGSEVAATLCQLGLEVSVVEPQKILLAHALGDAVGGIFEILHREKGIRLYLGELVTQFEGEGRVQRVITNQGNILDCDFVVYGIGVEPVTDVVAGTGVKIDNGIVVDEYCQTNMLDIFAAGDVANHYHPFVGKHIRVEHYQNAISQGQAAARNMLGKQVVYEETHWFWSNQYEHNIQYTGFHCEWDSFVVRGSMDTYDFIGFYLYEAQVLAAVAFNRNKDLRLTTKLIASKANVDVSNLQDEDVKIRSLISR